MTKRWTCYVLALLLTLAATVPTFALTDSALQSQINKTASYLLDAVQDPSITSTGGEWTVLGLAQSGILIDDAYFDTYYDNVYATVAANNGTLSNSKNTEYARVVLALTAIGKDPQNVAGYNLLTAFGDYTQTVRQGVNGPIWALIALDAHDYPMPTHTEATVQATRQLYVDAILDAQLPNGGWSLRGEGNAEPDVTAMALQALTPYANQPDVAHVIESTLTLLSSMQASDGSYAVFGQENLESAAQVLLMLCTLGIDENDPRFVKNGISLLDYLMGYALSSGGFAHVGTGVSLLATEQAFYSLVALQRARNNQTALFDFEHITLQEGTASAPTFGLPAMHDDIIPLPVVHANATFSDIGSHPHAEAIRALASRSIVSGKTDTTFAPNDTLTRAEFATIVVRALGLQPAAITNFNDVLHSSWYVGYVGTAYTYGLVSGKSATMFAPNEPITKQEAASLLVRTAKLCGMDTAITDAEIRNTLSSFSDYRSVADWASSALTFCYQAALFDYADITIEPTKAVTRAEMASMLYNLMDQANLLT